MRRALIASLAVLAAAPAAAGAATLQPVGTFSSPTYVTSDPTDPNRLFVVEQGGTIQLSDHGVVSEFLDIHTQVATGGERGLLSMALAPDYASTGHFYVYYTAAGTGALQIDEYTAAGTSASAATRRPILTIPHPGQANHNGGQLQFGPDGYLYLATGDGGGGNDQLHNAQDTSSLLGKLLRIDPATGTGPPGNPFADGVGGRAEIWAYGLRNPWRFSFDWATGALLIGDVGQGSHEEVDYVAQPNAGRGLNFGWSCREGLSAFPTTDPLCASASGFTNPIFDYPTHSDGRCAIVGGYVARDQSLGDLYGRYLYSDSCNGEVRSLIPGLPAATGDRSEGLSVSGPASFGQDSCARLYITSLGTGEVSRFVGGTDPCSSPSNPPEPPPTCRGEPATRVAGSGARIDGSPGDDVIVADRRDNRIKARGGDDIVCGLDGDDVIKGGSGKDRLRGGHGDDRCVGGNKDKLRSC